MPGSDKYINYQLRPAKSVERKMICSLIRQIQLSGGLTDFRYIGMGAKYFVDFMLIQHLNNPGGNPSPVRRMEITNPFYWKSRFR